MNRDIENFLASFPFAEETKDRYRRVLSMLVELDLSQLDAAGLLAFIRKPTWGDAWRYTALCSCRKFIQWMYGVNHPALSARVKQAKAKKQRVLSADKALELLASFDTTSSAGARDLAIACVLLDTGLRCSEVCRLRLADVDLEHRTLQVIVKGGQWGTAVFSEHTAHYIDQWLHHRKPADGVGTLFVGFRHQSLGRPLTREGLQGMVKRWGAVIGVKLSPHDFRRSFATLSTIYGAPSRVVQEAGRWSNIEMVERYTRSLNQDAITPYLPVTKLLK